MIISVTVPDRLRTLEMGSHSHEKPPTESTRLEYTNCTDANNSSGVVHGKSYVGNSNQIGVQYGRNVHEGDPNIGKSYSDPLAPPIVT